MVLTRQASNQCYLDIAEKSVNYIRRSKRNGEERQSRDSDGRRAV